MLTVLQRHREESRPAWQQEGTIFSSLEAEFDLSGVTEYYTLARKGGDGVVRRKVGLRPKEEWGRVWRRMRWWMIRRLMWRWVSTNI